MDRNRSPFKLNHVNRIPNKVKDIDITGIVSETGEDEFFTTKLENELFRKCNLVLESSQGKYVGLNTTEEVDTLLTSICRDFFSSTITTLCNGSWENIEVDG
ncbi:MAG: hypothetical protein EZS28_055882, partial [Streblomastix strix]